MTKRKTQTTAGPKRARPARAELSRLELEVMDVVWQLGQCSSAEVTAAFARKRKLAPTTIRTVLANLRKKNYLELVPTVERGYRMQAAIKRADVARTTLADLVGHLFGSRRQAIIYLLEDEQLDERELGEIRKLIDSKKKGSSS